MVTAKASRPSQLVIFDLCDTLYDANTTAGFIEHYGRLHGNDRIVSAVRRWTDRRSPFYYVGALAYRLFGVDLARRRLIASLAGEPGDRLEAGATDYAKNILPRLANHELHKRLAVHREIGDRVVLISSSLDVVAAPIATALGVEFRASTLGFEDRVCTGRLLRDLTGCKAHIVRELTAGQLPRIAVYTDNRSDRDLVMLADQAAIVIPAGRTFVRWGRPDCEYIRL